MLKATEDKTFPGAIVAGLASPWGQAVSAGDPSNTYFGSYREVFARDLYEAWTGLMADGDLATARDATLFLFNRQQLPDGSMPRNSLVNGKTAPDSFGTQLDEVAYPILMADQLGLTDPTLYTKHIKPAANFVVAHGPSFGAERWEEQGGYSPSTIAAEIAGLLAAADIADVNGDAGSARDLARRRRRLPALDQGLDRDHQRPAGRPPVLHPPVEDRRSQRRDHLQRRQRRPDARPARGDRRRASSSSSRLGVLPADDPDVAQSLPSSTRRSSRPRRAARAGIATTATATATARADGHPWAPSGQGTGHLWPVLSGRARRAALQTGDAGDAVALLDAMAQFASGVGLIPEQDWELPDLAASPFGTDPTIASIGFVNGKPAGSASPLTWSAGAFVRLAADIAAGRLRRPARQHRRPLHHHTQGQTHAHGDRPGRRRRRSPARR